MRRRRWRQGGRRRQGVTLPVSVWCPRCKMDVSEANWFRHMRDSHGWTREDFLRLLGGIANVQLHDDAALPPGSWPYMTVGQSPEAAS